MDNIISHFQPISLQEMSGIRLMNRTDTKFVTSAHKLELLLGMAVDDYYIQEIDGQRNMTYATVYFDSADYTFFRAHHDGHCGRQKVRIRTYVESRLNFLEVKTKDNHSKTHKQRIALDNGLQKTRSMEGTRFELGSEEWDFLNQQLSISPDVLVPKISNGFHRITLVNKAKTERLTIDTDLNFNNFDTQRRLSLPQLAIIELKRDGLQPSPIIRMLRTLRIQPSGFSKYCMGEAMTNPQLRQNRFKTRIRSIAKIV